jgi:hypothetical protein
VIELPAPRVGRPRGSRTAVLQSAEGEAREPLVGTLRDVTPLSIERVETDADRPCGGSWWNAITTWAIGSLLVPIFAT